jgi:hypothetical protein
VHWLIAVPIGLIVLASLMFVQHRGVRWAAPRDVRGTAVQQAPSLAARDVLVTDAALDDATPAASAVAATESISVEAPESRADSDADARLFQRGLAELLRKRPKPALAIFEGLRSESLRLLGRAMAQHDMRHAAESQLAIELLVRDHGDNVPYRVAQAYAWRGQNDEAFLWLDRALVQRDGGLSEVKYDPALRSLRKDPRYRALLGKMGQPR